MQTLAIPALDPPSPWETPAPVLFNTRKHHAGAIRQRIRNAIDAGSTALPELAEELVVVGAKLMDLYVGQFTPAEVAQLVVEQLQRAGRFELSSFRAWVEGLGGYGMVDLSDGSQWVLRVAEEGPRYLHMHPGRWVPQTRRVRANVLKSAVMTLAYIGIHGGDPLDRTLVNGVRQRFLGLSPVGRDLDGDQGLGEVIELLR